MSKEVVLDIETDGLIGANGAMPKITLIGVYYYETDEYASYLEHELPNLWPRLERADRIIGYNTKGFDYPVMNSYYPGDFLTFPSLDLLEVITASLGFRLKLDAVAQATLGIGKSGHGLQALEYFRKGELDKLRAYCLQDVKVTKEVYDYGLQHGEIFYLDRAASKKAVKVNWKLPTSKPNPINLTMPF
ncbi:MAG: ribonuclease H-like domain-containing protein [Patescibacteria group bacterium]|nr:MAG: ribonuclease H-like domain-containing protein [Patescibacteria group bacterium]